MPRRPQCHCHIRRSGRIKRRWDKRGSRHLTVEGQLNTAAINLERTPASPGGKLVINRPLFRRAHTRAHTHHSAVSGGGWEHLQGSLWGAGGASETQTAFREVLTSNFSFPDGKRNDQVKRLKSQPVHVTNWDIGLFGHLKTGSSSHWAKRTMAWAREAEEAEQLGILQATAAGIGAVAARQQASA